MPTANERDSRAHATIARARAEFPQPTDRPRIRTHAHAPRRSLVCAVGCQLPCRSAGQSHVRTQGTRGMQRHIMVVDVYSAGGALSRTRRCGAGVSIVHAAPAVDGDSRRHAATAIRCVVCVCALSISRLGGACGMHMMAGALSAAARGSQRRARIRTGSTQGGTYRSSMSLGMYTNARGSLSVLRWGGGEKLGPVAGGSSRHGRTATHNLRDA